MTLYPCGARKERLYCAVLKNQHSYLGINQCLGPTTLTILTIKQLGICQNLSKVVKTTAILTSVRPLLQ